MIDLVQVRAGNIAQSAVNMKSHMCISVVSYLAEMLHEKERRLLNPSTLPLAALHHDGHGVEVLLFGPGDDLHVVLVHDGPHVRAVGVGSRLK